MKVQLGRNEVRRMRRVVRFGSVEKARRTIRVVSRNKNETPTSASAGSGGDYSRSRVEKYIALRFSQAIPLSTPKW